MLNVILVKTGTAYKALYANKMLSMLSRHLGIPHRVYCLTNTPKGLHPDITVINPPEAFESWWDKLYLFSDLMPEGPLLYLDLDQVIVGDITEIVQECLKNTFSCYSDHIGFGGVKLGTAFMTISQAQFTDLFDKFWKNRHNIIKEYAGGGDQVYLGHQISNDRIWYFNEYFQPETVQSFKYDYLKKGLSPFTKILNFHGRPKPHAVRDPFVLGHWQ